MRPRDVISTVVGNLRRMRLKIVLTTLGVVIGTASVVLMVSIGAGLQRSVEQTFQQYNIATQITVMGADMGMPEQVEGGGISASAKRKAKKLNDDAVAAISKIDGVEAVMPRLSVNAGVMRLGKRQFGASVFGVTPESLEAFGFTTDQGRMMSSGNEAVVGAIVPALAVMDMSGNQMVDPYSPDAPRLDMLGKRVVLETYPNEQAKPGSGEDTKPVNRKVLITGILKQGDPMNDTSLYVPLKTAKKFGDSSAKKTVYESILVKTASAAKTEEVATAVNEMGYLAQTQGGEIESVKQVFLIIQLVLGGIGGIALLVASLGIANTMTMSIYERTREIGIMKAVGASGRQIRQIFLGEAASIGLLGGVGGLLLAVGVAALANLFMKQMFSSQAGSGNPFGSGDLFYVSAGLAAFAVVFAAAIGLVAGILPAIRAANLDPLAALRHE